MRPASPPPLPLLAIGLVAFLALGGCSDGTDVSSTTTTTRSNATTTLPSISTTAAPATTTSTSTSSSTTTSTTSTTTTVAPSTTAAGSGEPPGNHPPEVTITRPRHLSLHAAAFSETHGMWGAEATFAADVIDPDGDPVAVEWHSSIRGLLGTGTSLTVFIDTNGSDASQPFITARAIDQWGRAGEDEIQIIVWVPSDT